MWFWTWRNWECNVLEWHIFIVLLKNKNKNKSSNYLLKQLLCKLTFKGGNKSSLWGTCYKVWLFSLGIFLFLFPPTGKPPLLQHVCSAQTRAMNSLPLLTKLTEQLQLWPSVLTWHKNLARNSHCVQIYCILWFYIRWCYVILKASFPSVSIQILCLSNIKI